MAVCLVMDIITKKWLDVFTGSIWLINLFACAWFYNQADKLIDAAQYFTEKQEKLEENESKN